MDETHTQHELVRSLQRLIHRAEADAGGDVVSTGCAALDAALPGGGLRRGTLVEWLAAGAGSGAATLALLVAREACGPRGTLVVVDATGEFYPPGAARLGLDPRRMIVARPANAPDGAWALDQALRCRGAAAVLGWVERLDGRAFRRLQLAAESGGGLGLFVRPARAAGEPSWADVRLRVAPQTSAAGRRLQVEVLRCRGGTGSPAVLLLEYDDEKGTLHLASQLAHPTAVRRTRRA